MISTIGFDADDTLWQNEAFFRMTQARFVQLLSDADPDHLNARLEAAERRNLGHYGFGIKGFMLSMIETAVEVTDGKVPGRVIAEILAAGQEMLSHPVHLLPGAAEAVDALRTDYTLIVITKGDLLDQERKLAQSGLGDLFHGVEIVSHKTPDTYRQAFARHGTGAEQALMVGNSLKSDVLPSIEAGAWGIYVPHEHSWALEHAEPPDKVARYRCIKSLAELPSLIRDLKHLP